MALRGKSKNASATTFCPALDSGEETALDSGEETGCLY